MREHLARSYCLPTAENNDGNRQRVNGVSGLRRPSDRSQSRQQCDAATTSHSIRSLSKAAFHRGRFVHGSKKYRTDTFSVLQIFNMRTASILSEPASIASNACSEISSDAANVSSVIPRSDLFLRRRSPTVRSIEQIFGALASGAALATAMRLRAALSWRTLPADWRHAFPPAAFFTPTRAMTPTPFVVRSRIAARCRTSRPGPIGNGKIASRRSFTETATPSNGCSAG